MSCILSAPLVRGHHPASGRRKIRGQKWLENVRPLALQPGAPEADHSKRQKQSKERGFLGLQEMEGMQSTCILYLLWKLQFQTRRPQAGLPSWHTLISLHWFWSIGWWRGDSKELWAPPRGSMENSPCPGQSPPVASLPNEKSMFPSNPLSHKQFQKIFKYW